MTDLHPQRPAESILPTLSDDLPDLEISIDEVQTIVGQTKNSVTNCPITSLRYEHLKKMIGRSSDSDELDFLDSLTWMINSIANGKVPEDVAIFLRSTQAVAIAKKDNNIRPLGLRDGLVNLTTKCILKHLQKETFKIFDGLNYALAGPKKMDELIALIAHAFRLKPEHDRLFIDCVNAFNKVDRAEAAKAIIATCPRLAKYFYFLYEEDTNIWIRSSEHEWTTISGSQGGIQGCVQAPIVFGFGSLIPYQNISSFLKPKENAIFGAFLDDSVISAAHKDTIEAFDIFKTDGPKHGLEINYGPNKTVVLLGKCANDAEVQQRIAAYCVRGIPLSNIKIHPDNGGADEDYGYIHLGVPVGSKVYQQQHLHLLVEKFIEVCECDDIVEEAQSKWVYLLWVIRQKFPFWFRHMCPTITFTVEAKVEAHMRNKFDTILGQRTSDKDWAKACLPTKTHGCGLGKPKDIISAAFAANVEETLKAVQDKLPGTAAYMDMIHASTEDFDAYDFPSLDIMLFVRGARDHKAVVVAAANALDELEILTTYDAKVGKKKTQHFYSDIINRFRAKKMEELIKDHGMAIEKAGFLSNDGSFAGAWLFNVPKDTHSTMSNPEFRTALMLRLGIKFSSLMSRCCCPQKTTICPHGVHLFSCNEFKPLLQMRHNAIQHDLMQLGLHGAVRVIDSGLGQMMDRDGRKGDLLFPGHGRGNSDLVVDLTIGNATAQSYLEQSSYISKHVIGILETNKNTKYAAGYREMGVDFMPLAFEMHGAISDSFTKFFKKLIKSAAEVNDIHYCIMFSYWQKRMSTTMQKYNAKILHLSQNKIARVTGLLRNGDIDLNDAITNVRHIHDAV